MIHSHEIIKCEKCGDAIAQCRCFSKDKPVRYSVCEQCKQKGLRVNE